MNRRLSSLLLALVLCAPSLGNAQENPWAPRGSAPKPTTGVVVFFREKRFAGGGVPFKVREGTTELGKLTNGSYFTVRARSGKHEYVVHSETSDVLTLEVEPGETYFVTMKVGMGVALYRPNLAPSDRQTFIKLYDQLKDVTGKGIN
jgi:hypothetical protein